MIENIGALFQHFVTRFNRPDALTYFGRDGRLHHISTNEFKDRVLHLAMGLKSLGVRPDRKVLLYAENRPKWHMVDFACHLLGAVVVAVEPSAAVQEVDRIIDLSDSGYAVISRETAERLSRTSRGLRRFKQVIALDREAMNGGVLFEDLLEKGRQDDYTPFFETATQSIPSETTATVLYRPHHIGAEKVVALSHGNLLAGAHACANVLKLNQADRAFSVLANSNIVARVFGYINFLKGANQIFGDAQTFHEHARLTKPTVVLGNPEFYEVAKANMAAILGNQPGVMGFLQRTAVRLGKRRATGQLLDAKSGVFADLFLRMIDRVTLAKVRRGFGPHVKFLISSGPTLPSETVHFYFMLGLKLLEGFGLPETSAFFALNPPDKPRLGSIGKPLPGISVRLSQDGKILVKGPQIRRTQQVGSKEEPDGWFCTGYRANIDDEGYLILVNGQEG